MLIKLKDHNLFMGAVIPDACVYWHHFKHSLSLGRVQVEVAITTHLKKNGLLWIKNNNLWVGLVYPFGKEMGQMGQQLDLCESTNGSNGSLKGRMITQPPLGVFF